MKRSFSLSTIGRGSAQKWFWDEVVEMIGACGYDGIEIPFTVWTFNAGRSGAPLCAVAIRTKFGSVKNYVDFLHASRVVDGISSIYISVDNVLETMFEYNVPQDKIFERTVEHGKETAEVLAEAGSKALIISPSPKIATMRSTYSDMSEEDRVSWFMDNIAVAINDVAAFAKSMGVDTYIRNDFWGYARGNNVIGLMDRLDSGIGFSPDLAQLEIAGVSAEELIDKYAGRVGYFKACDTFYKDELGYFEKHNPEYPAEGNNQRVYCDLGNGNVNVPSAYKAFAKAGGDWVVLDSRDSFNYVKALVKMQVYANKHFED